MRDEASGRFKEHAWQNSGYKSWTTRMNCISVTFSATQQAPQPSAATTTTAELLAQ